MRNITAKVDNRVITFSSTDGLNWFVSSVSPGTEGVYPVELTISDEYGITYTFTPEDPQFGDYLKLYVTNHNSKLIRYIPDFLKEVKEFKVLFAAEDAEVDILYPTIESLYAEALIMSCSEERIREWEKALKIVPQGTLEERRFYIKGILNGTGKLNEGRIKTIVRAFTGGEAIVTFSESAILVKILPPNNGEIFRFPDVERTLKPLIPAHLGLSVRRFYSTWNDIKTNYADWTSVSEAEDWAAVKNWIAP